MADHVGDQACGRFGPRHVSCWATATATRARRSARVRRPRGTRAQPARWLGRRRHHEQAPPAQWTPSETPPPSPSPAPGVSTGPASTPPGPNEQQCPPTFRRPVDTAVRTQPSETSTAPDTATASPTPPDRTQPPQPPAAPPPDSAHQLPSPNPATNAYPAQPGVWRGLTLDRWAPRDCRDHRHWRGLPLGNASRRSWTIVSVGWPMVAKSGGTSISEVQAG